MNLIGSIVSNNNNNNNSSVKEASETKTKPSVACDRSRASRIVSDRSIEQLKAARIALERANAEYAAWIAQTGSSHGSDTAAAIRRELKIDLLLLELNRHLAEIDRVALRPNARRQ
jgi:hypothetical protein